VAVVGATALFGWLAPGTPAWGRFALLLLAMLGGQLAIGALNEFVDRAADAIDQPGKPIPRGAVTPRGALTLTAGGLALMLAAGAPLGPWPFAVLLLGTGCGLAYDLWLKRTPLSWLPYLVALPLVPLWAWLTLDGFEPRLLWLYPLGALLVVAIHLAQSLPDIEGDRRQGTRGLAVALGRRWTERVIWGAGYTSAGLVALAGWRFGERPLAGILAAGLTGLALLAALLLHRHAPARVEARLFEALAACAIILGIGWTLAL
jgi:4-hydroxybenzoate polyprenyltransferase